ncbi:baseplate wedge protein [Arthrobacter phage EastWest]|uniref:Baseplate wedge protein n=1 Tax=Arthrobacter phage EastWest TaxID=2894292 RepID=A0AAE9C9J1_9CAUD|nr:baseplate wedge protein [Arthrobacter phage EastWest]
MTDGVLSFPFQLTMTGAAATVAHGSDAEIDQAIAVLVLTNIGEHLMAPDYGVPDPAFDELQIGDVQAGLQQFGPAGVQITSLTMEPRNDTEAIAQINWAHAEEGEES